MLSFFSAPLYFLISKCFILTLGAVEKKRQNRFEYMCTYREINKMRLDKCEYPSRKSSSEPLHITVNIDNLNAGYLLSKGKKGKKKGGGGIELTLA